MENFGKHGKSDISLPAHPEPLPAGEINEDQAEEISLGSIRGSATGEGDRDVVPGGWGGTEDATSTAPSDMPGISLSPDGLPPEPDIEKIGDDLGDISDLLETNAEDDEMNPAGI